MKGLYGGLTKGSDIESVPKITGKKYLSTQKIVSTYDNIKSKLFKK